MDRKLSVVNFIRNLKKSNLGSYMKAFCTNYKPVFIDLEIFFNFCKKYLYIHMDHKLSGVNFIKNLRKH